jgi:membrane-associated phospholipid phosphatase
MKGKIAGAIFSAALITALAASTPARADTIEKAGNVLKIAMPLATAGLTVLKDDREGLAQFGIVYGATMLTSFGLKSFIHEDRPDHSDDNSFPSDSTASAFAAASFLDQRYGWEIGLPSYALASFVGYSRVEADKHHVGDVVAGALIGWGFNQLITTRSDITVHPMLGTDYFGLGLDLKW